MRSLARRARKALAVPSVSSLAALAALLALQVGAAADTLVLKDGRVFDKITVTSEDGGVLIHFEHGDVLVPEEQVETIVTPNTDFEPRTEEERERFKKGQVPYKGKWVSIRQRDRQIQKDLEALREEIEETKNRRKWVNRAIIETKNFTFESTAPPAITENYINLCEEYFSEFIKLWRIRKPRGHTNLKLKFFVNQEDFLQVTGVPRGVLGFFRFIEPYELCVFYDRLDPIGTEEVLYHEVGHYLQKLIDVDFKMPHWPGESISEYYSASTWDPVKKKLEWGGIHEGRATLIHMDIEKGDWVSVDRLLTGALERTFHDYTWGWSFAHYLMSTGRYAKNFRKFVLGLASAKDIDRTSLSFGRTSLRTVDGRAMKEGFLKYMKIKGDDGLQELQDEWYSHIKENLVITSARGYEGAAFRAQRSGRTQRAKRMYEDAIELGTEKSLTYHRYADILEGLGEEKEARLNWKKAIRLDPLISDYYIALGESYLLRPEDKDSFATGEKYLLLALDIEPDNHYLELNMDSLLVRGRKASKRIGGKSSPKEKEPEKKEPEKKEKEEGDEAG